MDTKKPSTALNEGLTVPRLPPIIDQRGAVVPKPAAILLKPTTTQTANVGNKAAK